MAAITLSSNVSLTENTNQDFNLYNVLGQAGLEAPPPIATLAIQIKNPNGTYSTAPAGTYAGLDLDAGIGKETLRISMSSQPGFTGNQTLKLIITDGARNSVTLYLEVHVLPVPPVAQADTQAILQDTVASGNVLDNDSDPKGLPLTVTGFTVAGQTLDAGGSAVIANVGTLSIAANGSYSFTPLPGYTGPVPTATYTISDGTATSTADLTVTVMPGAPDIVNVAPIAQPDTAITGEDQAISGNVLDNDSDADSDTLTVTEFVVGGVTYPAGSTVDVPGQGSLTLNADGSYTFTPLPNFNGPGPEVGYTITDGQATNSATLYIGVIPENDAPLALPDAQTIPEDTTATGNVLPNDSDADGDSLTVTQFVVNGSTYAAGSTATIANVGTLAINTNGSYTFTPVAGYSGTVPVASYSISDGNGGTAASTLSLNVTPSPDTTGIHIVKLVEGIYSTGSGGEGLTPGYWKNHTPDRYGSASEWNKTGYSPTDSFNTVFGVNVPGNPTLLTALSTGGGGLIALMRQATAALLSTSDPNISYLYSKAQAISMTQEAILTGQYLAVKNLFDTQNNLEADLSTPASASTTIITPMADANTPADSVAIPVNGEARFTYLVANTGTAPLANVKVSDSAVSNVTYVSGDSNNNGLLDVGETWTYTDFQMISATGLQLSTATVTAVNANTGQSATDSDVTYINTLASGGTNRAPDAVNDSVATTEDKVVSGKVLGNDTDADGDVLSVTGFSINGRNYAVGSTATLSGIGTLIIKSDGSYSFKPAAGYSGAVPSASYSISDGHGGKDTATLSISMTPKNTGPVAQDDTGKTISGQSLSGNVLSNDTDADGDRLTVTGFSVAGRSYAADATATLAGVGSLTLHADGSYSFTPVSGYTGTAPVATYTIADGRGGSDTATLTITVSKNGCSGSTGGSGSSDHHESDHGSGGHGDSDDEHDSDNHGGSSCQGGSDGHDDAEHDSDSHGGSSCDSRDRSDSSCDRDSDRDGRDGGKHGEDACDGKSKDWSAFCQSDSEGWGNGNWSSGDKGCSSGTSQGGKTPALGDILCRDDNLDKLLGCSTPSADHGGGTTAQSGCGSLDALKALSHLAEQHQAAAHA